MIRRMKVILTGLGLSLVLVSASGYAQDRAQQPPSYTPTATPSEKLPDWSGAWQMMGGTVFDAATQTGKGGAIDLGVREHPPYNAEWEALYQRNLEKRDQNRFPDVFTNCGVPASYPRVFNLPDPYEFVIRPEQVWILAENGPNVMRIYTDGRKHLDEPWGTYTGDSVGHWEGDTLVFTTIGLKGNRDGDSILDRTGLVLSDQSRGTTRIRKIDANTLEVVMTLEDSKALTKPWAVTKRFRKLPQGTRLYDYGCAENNRNPVDEKSGKTLLLGPDGKPLND
ncbi:MAG: hypothetical protein DMG16_04810 [Acidobacteria bacterium]|nr:MAG: hypothetical protein DMG16_04810 [Acidobacteriota bacterium]